jgi:hypothetical protein
MKHSIEELIQVVYRYYPRGLLIDDPRYKESEEYQRLVAARRQAGTNNDQWRAMLRRLGDQFPKNGVQNRSLHLPGGDWDACYSCCLFLATAPGEHYHSVEFLVSFLVPYVRAEGKPRVSSLARLWASLRGLRNRQACIRSWSSELRSDAEKAENEGAVRLRSQGWPPGGLAGALIPSGISERDAGDTGAPDGQSVAAPAETQQAP